MNTILVLLAIATFFFTLIGGFITIKFKKSLPYFFAFSAGAMIAVVFLDLLPESLEIAEIAGISVRTIMLISLGSFFLFSLIEKVFATHHIHSSNKEHSHVMGPIGASSMVFHSFLDGAAIGIAFQVDIFAGIVVALAVLMHDITDGINTVVLMLKNHQSVKKSIVFLFLDAIAPVLGLVLASVISLPSNWLAFILAFFVGEFLYIGASTLVPETREHPSKKLILLMALGILLIIFLTGLIPE